ADCGAGAGTQVVKFLMGLQIRPAERFAECGVRRWKIGCAASAGEIKRSEHRQNKNNKESAKRESENHTFILSGIMESCPPAARSSSSMACSTESFGFPCST